MLPSVTAAPGTGASARSKAEIQEVRQRLCSDHFCFLTTLSIGLQMIDLREDLT